MNFDAVVRSFTESPQARVHGALSGYIYDMPQFVGDRVQGGIHYAQYVEHPTSLIPQRQPTLLESFAQQVSELVPQGASFFDLGPGPAWSVQRNTVPALTHLQPACYIPVDLEPEFTEEACRVIAQTFPQVAIQKLTSNFHREALPPAPTPTSVVWYPGSTLGNLPSLPTTAFTENPFVKEHLQLLRQSQSHDPSQPAAATRYLILLMDRKKENISAMQDLYRSANAVGCFQSILYKLKRDLKAQDFDPDAFSYEPCWNAQTSAVEHTFTAKRSQSFTISDPFSDAQETLHVRSHDRYVLANSLKPSHDEMVTMLTHAGWTHLQSATDAHDQFHIHLACA